MTVRRFAATGLAMVGILAIAGVAHAQTQMRGVVKDATGGALPGVTVEAKSEVLIEGSKSAITDGEGVYLIQDLRPGKYEVIFTLQGFQTITNKDITLSADQTTTVNADLKLGGRGEELTITGAAATVDVQNATKITTLERSVLDNLPIGNNIWEMAQMIPQIDMYSDFSRRSSSVGGSLGAVQNYMSVNGQLASNNVVMVDGMSVSGLELNGTMQAYFNNDMNSEVSYQTSGISADRSGGGVTVNMIPREGGNRFSGDGKLSFRPEAWIGANTTDRIQSMGLTSKSSLKFLEDETISEGGPILKNKLWFFASWHQFKTSDYVPNSVRNDGSQFDGEQRTRQGSGRLTYQATPRVKLSGYYDRTEKYEGNQIDSFDDPESALYFQTSPNYATGNVKLTSTLTSRLLLEGGYSMNREWRNQQGQPFYDFPRDTPEWYEYARKSASGGAVNTFGTCGSCRNWPGRDNYQGSLSYVTGAHQIKVGAQWQTGRFYHSNSGNADSWINYQTQTKASCPAALADSHGNCKNRDLVADPNGFEWKIEGPTSVTAWNVPTQSQDRLNGDIGIYFQDSYRFKRVTFNPGLRWEHVNAQNDAYSTGEGRWAPVRSINGVQNVPDWYDWAPRFNAVWDVFGNARTAAKFSYNRYNQAAATALAQGFNTLVVTSRTLSWTDKNGNDITDGRPGMVYNAAGTPIDYGPAYYNCANPSGAFTTGYLDPANPCEINMGPLKNAQGVMFGLPGAESSYVGYPRSWLLESIVEVQHAVTRRLSVTGSWTRAQGKDLTKTVNGAFREGDWTPFTLYNPIDGTPITYWQIKDAETQTRHNTSALNVSYVEPQRRQINQTYALEFRMRPYAGAQIFGGFTMQRFNGVNCDTSFEGYIVNPNGYRFCDAFHQSAVDDRGIYDSERSGTIQGFQRLGFTAQGPIADQGGQTPMAKDFRLGVSLPLPWYGINLGVSYLNNDEGAEGPPNLTVTLLGNMSLTTCGGGQTRYTDGLTGCTNQAGTGPPATATDPIIRGASNTRKVATATAPACPTTYGCVPGAFITPAGFRAGATATTISTDLFPSGRVRRERLNQLGLQVSKTFRVNRLSILPTFTADNIFNQDKINSSASSIYATTGGTYHIPGSLLQARIIGFGVQVRW